MQQIKPYFLSIEKRARNKMDSNNKSKKRNENYRGQKQIKNRNQAKQIYFW
jgi:hypothetical protein